MHHSPSIILTSLTYFLIFSGSASATSLTTRSHGTSAAPHVPVESRTLDEIYQAALKESGTLRFSYAADTLIPGKRVASLFNARFPGLKINVTSEASKYEYGIFDRIFNSTNGQDNGADCFTLQTVNMFPIWKSQHRLMPYKVAVWDDIHPELQDRDGFYTGYFIHLFGPIIYNPSKLAESDVSSTFADFIKPFWKNKLTLVYPNDDDSVLFLMSLIVTGYGWEYFYALAQQNVTWVRGTAVPAFLLAPTAPPTSLVASFTTVALNASSVSTKFPNDRYMTWPQTGAIFVNTKMPETAKLMMNYLASDEYQTLVTRNGFSVRKKFDTKGVLTNPYTDPLAFAKFMADRANVEQWRMNFESILGLPQGPDPITVPAFN